VGGNWRTDFIDTLANPTIARSPSGAPTLNADVDQTDLGVFAQLQIQPVPWLKITGGARYDHFFYSIDNRLPAGISSNPNLDIWSPKAGVAVAPLPWLTLFANYGEGFRAPDAVLELLTQPNLRALTLESYEGGVQFALGGRGTLLLDGWYTRLSNEIFQPAPGLPLQNLGSSQRTGFDIDGRYTVVGGTRGAVDLVANYGMIWATLLNRPGDSRFVPNVPAFILNVGTEFDLAVFGSQRLSGSLFVGVIGPKNLTEDGRLTTSAYERVAARLNYSFLQNWMAYTEIVAYPGNRLSEVAINFGPGTGASPADIFVSPVPPVSVMAGIAYRFDTR